MHLDHKRVALILTAVAIAAAPALAIATETITYTYDNQGRVVQVQRSGTVNNGVVTNYSYDKADNRTNKTTTGSGQSSKPESFLGKVAIVLAKFVWRPWK
jgi:YD repeat-containing protein